MDRLDDTVTIDSELGGFFLRVSAPQNKNEALFLVEHIDNSISELLPAKLFVAIGLVRADREASVEKEDTLFCPFDKAPVAGFAAK